MGYRYLVVDDETGKRKRGGPASGVGSLFVDQKYVVIAAEGETEFVFTEGFVVSSLIDVYVNGRMYDEGAGEDYQRNAGDGKIIFNYSIPKNAKIRIRVYS